MIHRERFFELALALASVGCAPAATRPPVPKSIPAVAPEPAVAEEDPPAESSKPTSDVVPGPPQGVGLGPEPQPESVEEGPAPELGDTCGE